MYFLDILNEYCYNLATRTRVDLRQKALFGAYYIPSSVFFFETSLALSIFPCKILIVMALVPVANAPDASKYRLCIAYMCVYNLLTRRNDCRGFTPTYCHMKWRFGSQNRKLLLFKGGVVLCTSFREFYCQKILSLKSKRRDSIGRTF